LQGIVIKSHGGANVNAFFHAIKEAIVQIEKNIPQRISAEVEHMLKITSAEKSDDQTPPDDPQ